MKWNSILEQRMWFAISSPSQYTTLWEADTLEADTLTTKPAWHVMWQKVCENKKRSKFYETAPTHQKPAHGSGFASPNNEDFIYFVIY